MFGKPLIPHTIALYYLDAIAMTFSVFLFMVPAIKTPFTHYEDTIC